MITPMDPYLIRIIGYGYELPRIPVAVQVGWTLELQKQPDFLALSVNDGPIVIARKV